MVKHEPLAEEESPTGSAACSVECTTGETVEAQPELAGHLTQVQHVVTKWRLRRRRVLAASGQLMAAALTAPWLLFLLERWRAMPWAERPVMLFMFLGLVAGLVGALAGLIMRPIRSDTIDRLLQTDDPRLVGALAEACLLLMPDVTVRASDALRRLLPRVGPDQRPDEQARRHHRGRPVRGHVPRLARHRGRRRAASPPVPRHSACPGAGRNR